MTTNTGVNINQSHAELSPLSIGQTLTLGKPPERQGFGFAVMQHRPSRIGTQELVKAPPPERFIVIAEHEQRVIARSFWVPTAISTPREQHETMQEIVACIRIRFDVVEQHARGSHQFR